MILVLVLKLTVTIAVAHGHVVVCMYVVASLVLGVAPWAPGVAFGAKYTCSFPSHVAITVPITSTSMSGKYVFSGCMVGMHFFFS